MGGLLGTWLVTLLYVASAQTAISCPEERQRIRKVTENKSTWDVGPDIGESVCAWRLEVDDPDRVIVVMPTGDPAQAPGCKNLSVEFSPNRKEHLCGVFWSSDRVLVLYLTPPDNATSFQFNITYYSKMKDDYESQTVFQAYPDPSVIWVSGSQHADSNTSYPVFDWLLKTHSACIEIKVLDHPSIRRYISVHDGSDAESPELGVCGGLDPGQISGTTNAMFVRRKSHTDLFTKTTSPQPGFWISFKSTSVCNGDVIHLRAASDIQAIHSPTISPTNQSYPTNIKCRWLIQSASTGNVISLKALKSDLESTYKCVKDSLVAFEPLTSVLIKRWCGQTEPNLVSSSSTMLVEFVSDSSDVKPGFLLQYRTRDKVTCGSTYLNAPTTGYRRVFESPGYPAYYPNNLDCEWQVQSDSAYYGVRLELTMVNLERTDQGDCVDYLHIQDGDAVRSSVCKPGHAGKMFESSQYGLVVSFHSNSNITYPGFKITYYSFPKSTKDFGCKAYLNATENPQQLFSPAYPQDYPNNLHCSWIFKAKEHDSIIVIEVVDSEMEISPTDDGDCSADYGVAYDGPDETYPVLGRWCGLAEPSFRSRSQYLNLVFVTDPVRRYRGFEINFYTMKDYKFCPYRRVMKLAATSRIKYFNSPNYPKNYPSNIDCRWLISAPNSSMVVKLVVVESDLETSQVCSFDAVYVYDGKQATAVKQLGYFCGASTPVFRSTQQHMYLEFKSDSSTSERGFKIMYQAIRISDSKNSSVVGIIIGCVLGGLALVAAIATTTVFIVRRRKQRGREPQTDSRARRASGIVVNVNRTDNTVFFMSPVFFTHGDSTDHLELPAPPPYPGLPNDSFISDCQHLYDVNDLPPPYSEIDTSLTSASNVLPPTVPNAGDTSAARGEPGAETSPPRPVIYRDRRRPGFGKPNRNSIETCV
ncbi:cubilin-like [Gigantopelta aegis]|uniref:cubilin-like n=1 Tax=Gigantopelta aegis TaxID=1735272 RepID=UPI001B88D8F4|nr:cubilin-like [Gigantopelta aegis]